MLGIGIGLIVVAVLGLVVGGVIYARQASTGDVQLRLDEYANRSTPVTLEEIELSQPFSERVILPLVQGMSGFVARFTPQRSIEKSRRDLEMAGRPVKSPEIFFVIKTAVAAVLGVIGALTLSISGQGFLNTTVFSIILALIGFILPGVWLGGKIRSRQDEIIKALPDALDLLVICVEAGLGFQQAMGKVAEKWDNELAKAFARALQEIQLGKTMVSSLREMEQNMGVPDMTSFVAAIVQATSFGVSIGKVLRIQSDQMRIKRRQRAEKKAQEAPIKMLFPMVFLIFPSLFIVLLGPAALLVMESFGTSFF
ncbi:MAG: type II secretion system F family protein [Chloroflexota bacterium]